MQVGPYGYYARRYAPPIAMAGAAYQYGRSTMKASADAANAVGRYAAQAASSAARSAARTVYNRYYGSGPVSARNSRTPTSAVVAARPFVRRKGKTLKAQVKNLSKIASADTGTHTERVRTTARTNCVVNGSSFDSFDCVNVTKIENVLTHLQYYDPAAPSTLVTASGLSGSYKKEFYFSKASSIIRVRNNYQVPCRYRFYIVVPKKDHSQDPDTAFSNGITDVGIASSNNALVYPTDSNQFNNLWRIVKTVKGILQPGKEKVFIYNAKPFNYDPSFVDTHSDTYQKRYGCHSLCVRIEGILGHDSAVTTEQTTLQCTVDIQIDTTYQVKYSAGAKISYVYLDNQADASFTNGGLVSSMPVADNIPYSLS